MKKWIFCTKTTCLKIVKAKDQLQWASQLSHDSPCSNFPRLITQSITGPYEGLSSRKLNSANRWQSQLFQWSHCRQLSFFTSQRVKRKICVQKVISYKEQKLSQCTGKHNYVIKSEENSDYYYLSTEQKNDRRSLFFSSKFTGILFPTKF